MRPIKVILFLFLVKGALAQENVVEYWTDAYYRTTLQKATYYSEGTKNTDNKYEGQVKYYNVKDSILVKLETRQNGEKKGKAIYYHKNGKIKRIDYPENENSVWESEFAWADKQEFYHENGVKLREWKLSGEDYILMAAWDSLGNPMIKDGEGNFRNYHENGKLSSEGVYQNYVKVGVWKGYDKKGALAYKEVFEKGVLIKGENYQANGLERYKSVEINASPEKGMTKFLKKLAKNVRYPNEARQLGIEGKVYVGFIVNKEGKPQNYIFIKGKREFEQAAIDAFQKTKMKWRPGYQHGKPVKQRMILPINFKL